MIQLNKFHNQVHIKKYQNNLVVIEHMIILMMKMKTKLTL